MRPMKSMLAAFLAALLLSGVFFLPLCGCGKGGSDTDRIKAAVRDMAEGAQAKDFAKVKGHIRQRLRRPQGHHALLLHAAGRHRRVPAAATG